jgi:hypothetical protein
MSQHEEHHQSVLGPAVTQQEPVNGTARSTAGEDSLCVDLSYSPVPARHTYPVRVICRLQGRGQPLPFPLDDD